MKKEIDTTNLSYRDRMVVEEHERLSPRLIYEIIRHNGICELTRPMKALVFSGVIAGLLISFSFICKAVLAAHLPDEPWAPLISNLGYTVGFILVILGRLQLFTENTITTVVPMLNPLTMRKVLAVTKLWIVVLVSNLVGTTLAALFLQNHHVLNPEYVLQLNKIAQHAADFSFVDNLWRGVPSGILVAAIVWILPTAKNSSFIIIAVLTYFIALGDFTHIVVGSSEMAYWVMKGQASLYDYFIDFLIPTGLGNVIGGTVVFTLLIYVQVIEELRN